MSCRRIAARGGPSCIDWGFGWIVGAHVGVELRSRRRWKQATSSTCRERERERGREVEMEGVCVGGGGYSRRRTSVDLPALV